MKSVNERRGHNPTLLKSALFALLALFYAADLALSQSPPTGPAGGDLAGTYPNPGLAVDRVRKTGDTMTGQLNITLPNPGSIVNPFSLSTSGNSGPNRGLAFTFNLPANPAAAFGAQIIAARESWGLSSYFSFSTHNGTAVAEALRIAGSGNVGIGTASPAQILHLSSAVTTGSGLRVDNTSTGGRNFRLLSSGSGNTGGAGKFHLFDETSSAFRLTVDSSGNVGVGTTTPTKKLDVAGDINATGTITGGNIVAKYQDVAEWVESSQALAAGTVVVLDQTKSNQVVASSQPYDTRVAGVISFLPGITLGENGEGKVLVATTGRVRIKVDATRGSIKIGDLLVTSDVSGFAMKSQPINVGGLQIHRPGTLIGKALEPLEKGVGEILVLLSLQ